MKFTIRIGKVTPSANEIKKMLYKKPYEYKKLREEWGWEFIPHKVTIGKAISKRKVTIVSMRGKRLDKDNFIGGMKPIFDAMQDTGLIINDDEEYLEHGDHDQIIGSSRETLITFEDIPYKDKKDG